MERKEKLKRTCRAISLSRTLSLINCATRYTEKYGQESVDRTRREANRKKTEQRFRDKEGKGGESEGKTKRQK